MPSQSQPGLTTGSVNQKSLKALAVDDDALVLMNTAAMLEDLGQIVVEATSGKQALQILAQEAIDLIVTDHAMPGMTGLQLVEAVEKFKPDILLSSRPAMPNCRAMARGSSSNSINRSCSPSFRMR